MSQNLIGDKIRNSQNIDKLMDQLMSEWMESTSSIKGIRPPQVEAIESGKAWVDKVGQKRGRPLYYPYVGTGAGRGAYVELEDGSVKMDLINGIGIHLMGHGHPDVVKASVRGALCDIVVQGNLQPNREYFQFSEKLVELASRKSRLKYAWLATCGTMANESALKITRQKHSPARKVLAFKDAFAGRSTMMAEVTDNPAYKVGLPSYDEILRLPFYDKKNGGTGGHEKTLNAMKEHWDKNPHNISTFVFEPMLGEGGYKRAPREFFVPLLEFCKEKKIAVWADEIQTFTRTGEIFAFETLGIGEYIDLCTIAKTAQ
ncbi:MAG: aminotransferase class III-fold pyridoxal phosphate-dependent enzyme, partial [Pseudobdellovibrionaceae bacterium]